ncbi:hypothetical protein H9P43_009603 [Blastocladiella emersonii ATCC 22665]|nr:hypothetical protein H9P43_009603 [Blastocladiella emersonii ATCC 22665]
MSTPTDPTKQLSTKTTSGAGIPSEEDLPADRLRRAGFPRTLDDTVPGDPNAGIDEPEAPPAGMVGRVRKAVADVLSGALGDYVDVYPESMGTSAAADPSTAKAVEESGIQAKARAGLAHAEEVLEKMLETVSPFASDTPGSETTTAARKVADAAKGAGVSAAESTKAATRSAAGTAKDAGAAARDTAMSAGTVARDTAMSAGTAARDTAVSAAGSAQATASSAAQTARFAATTASNKAADTAAAATGAAMETAAQAGETAQATESYLSSIAHQLVDASWHAIESAEHTAMSYVGAAKDLVAHEMEVLRDRAIAVPGQVVHAAQDVLTSVEVRALHGAEVAVEQAERGIETVRGSLAAVAGSAPARAVRDAQTEMAKEVGEVVDRVERATDEFVADVEDKVRDMGEEGAEFDLVVMQGHGTPTPGALADDDAKMAADAPHPAPQEAKPKPEAPLPPPKNVSKADQSKVTGPSTSAAATPPGPAHVAQYYPFGSADKRAMAPFPTADEQGEHTPESRGKGAAGEVPREHVAEAPIAQAINQGDLPSFAAVVKSPDALGDVPAADPLRSVAEE